MSKEIEFARELIDFIYSSPTAFQAVKEIRDVLSRNDFIELNPRNKWIISKGGRYFLIRNDSALIAFVVGEGEVKHDGFRLICTHTDSPSFKIKPAPEMVRNSYLKLNTEVYGSPILNTWFDRPLSLAGRLSLKGDNLIFPDKRLINLNKPLLIIPNLAIHMNANVNKGIEINKQNDVLPLLSIVKNDFEKDNFLLELLAEEIDVKLKDIFDFDLFLYEYSRGQITGMHNEFISSSRLDDLAMVHAGLTALINSNNSKATKVLACFDNEEVGSTSKQGADSPMLRTLLERIVIALGMENEDFFRALANSFMISADMAHAIHPNFTEVYDPTNINIINNGPVIKINANQKYTSDSDSIAVYENICNEAGIPIQKFVNRSDQRSGSTIGPITLSHIDVRSIDIGNPMLAMHSIRELSGVSDHYNITESFKRFFIC
jgi:aspartyl aminopeptidase